MFPILFITGLPGSGKTTLGCQLKRRYDLIVHLDSDDVGFNPVEDVDKSTWTFRRALVKSQSNPVVATLLHVPVESKSVYGCTIWLDVPVVLCITRQPYAYPHITLKPTGSIYQVPAFDFVPPDTSWKITSVDDSVIAEMINLLKIRY